MIPTLSKMALNSLINASPDNEVMKSIIQTTFSGEKLALSLNQLFEALALIKTSEAVLFKTKLIQYGLKTTLIEEAEKCISTLEDSEQQTQREKLYQASDESLPLPSQEVMLTREGGHISASGTNNIKNGTYNVMLRQISDKHYALILDLDLHHPGLKKINHTFPLLKPMSSDNVFLWTKTQKNGFYERKSTNVFGKRSQIVQYQKNDLDVYVERGFNDEVLSDKPRLTISVTTFEKSNLHTAQAVMKQALFWLGLGTIIYPQRPVDRERVRIFSANRAKHLRDENNCLLSYQQERDLSNYESSLMALKNRLNTNAAELAITCETEILPNKLTWSYPLLEKKLCDNHIQFFYHSFIRIKDTHPKEIGSRMLTIFSDGLQSTMHRLRHGLFINGISSSADMNSGGGNSVFVRAHKCDDSDWIAENGYHCLFIVDTSCSKRVNSYMYKKDTYGSKEQLKYSTRQAPYEVTEGKLEFDNEFMVKDVIAPQAIIGLYVNKIYYDLLKKYIDKAIIKSGILDKQKKTLDEFIVHSSKAVKALVENHQPKQTEVKRLYDLNIEVNAKKRTLEI